jgi:hypothetical protein
MNNSNTGRRPFSKNTKRSNANSIKPYTLFNISKENSTGTDSTMNPVPSPLMSFKLNWN